ncbi:MULTISPECIES: 2-dehydropantoate 2-reductase [unclassified Oceanispirochaeta]|uniref:2-dehydropantoate 2-reductase n=1 Tax=unclassified Oceanispirochaeta TaxID=2635722 RepID=UPI0013142AED|nr:MULTISPECIES: 2-dehydropantoate 2-reductase [unclassified Oceanispirochaeta]MBF9018609.1 2-dehydropantoate 2-reductase [Oceanispirochaeta sp. M2]NPD75032.1 2-dehydropantoate 2-reductase [Oceanispirochaeta sp. M1]
MTFTVFGTGAVGAYYGGRLAELGNTVHFLARSDYDTIKESGLKIHSPKGDIFLENPSVFNKTDDIPPSDVVLIALKTTGNSILREQIAPLVHKDTALLVLQNGLGMEEEFQSWFPENPVLGGMCFICSRKKAPGIIEHLDYGLMTLGALNPDHKDLRDEVGRLMDEASVPVTLVDDLHEARWRKLLWNIPYNGLTVALNCNTQDIMTNPDSRHLIRVLMEEVIAGAAVCGCVIEKEAVEKMLIFTDKMTPYEPSMKLDFNYKRSMEIEYMYDRPLKEAASRGYVMKSVFMLRDQLKFIQSRY